MQARTQDRPGLNFDLTEWRPSTKRPVLLEPASLYVVAGARLFENVHLYAEPFPLVT